jgi:hypothetical protein
MTTKNVRFYRDPWMILSFPKRNRSILYNAHTRTYDFYTMNEKSGKPLATNAVPVKQTKTYKNLIRCILALAVISGISLAFNIVSILL